MQYLKLCFIFLTIAQSVTLQKIRKCPYNEVWKVCGNKCEDTCDNQCDPVVYITSVNLMPDSEGCKAGCYCMDGYIRKNKICVKNVPDVCCDDRCGSVSPHAIYQRCGGYTPACFSRNVPQTLLQFFVGGCTCQEGYSMNWKLQCIKTKSPACTYLANKKKQVLFLDTPTDCYDDYSYPSDPNPIDSNSSE